FFFSSRSRHTSFSRDWSSDVCSSDLGAGRLAEPDDAPPALVVVAALPDVTGDVVAAELTAHPEAVVTDVASVKGAVLHALREHEIGRASWRGRGGLTGAARPRDIEEH